MATDAPSRHVVIRASAGAGKTYRLVNHYLRLLHGGADPAGLLATTFTRKAAGEILASIIERLLAAVGDDTDRRVLADILDVPNLAVSDCHRLIGGLVSSLHRLSVGTIDSFFHRVASAFRWELDLPVDPIMAAAQSPEVTALRQEVISDVLAASNTTQDLSRLFRRLHGDRTTRAVGQAFDTLVLKLHDIWRLAPDRELWDQLEIPASLSDGELAEAIAGLEAMRPELPMTAAGRPNKTGEQAFEAALETARQARWEDFLRIPLVGRMLREEGERTYSSKETFQAWLDAFAPLIRHASSPVLEQLRQRHLASFELLSRFDETYHRLRRGRRLLMFSDLTWKLARELPDLLRGQLPRIHHRLDVGIDHLLLDEFQDTSPSQWQVLEPFADKVTAPESEDQSLFVVGDVKQAIYGWRGGNAALFADVEQRYGILGEDLATSYRSVPVVMDLVNAVFGTVGSNPGIRDDPADRSAALRFGDGFVTHESAHHLQALPGYVDLRSSSAPPGEEEMELDEQLQEWPEAPISAVSTEVDDLDPPTSHEEYVARRVASLHAAHPSGSIAVLVRTNFMAARLLHEFRRKGGGHPALPVSGEGGSPLTGSPVVGAILSAFALADHPGDAAAAYHVATSPLGPILGLAPGSSGDVIAQTSHRLRRTLLDHGYTSLIGEWALQMASACDSDGVRQLQQLLELSYRYEPTVRPRDFVEFVEATAVEQTATAPIRVMTIHAAKGLEFDTVVLPELDKGLQYQYPVLLQRERESGPPSAVMPFANNDIRQLSPQLQVAYQQERTRRRYEDICVLYVALTRARKAVHMIIRPKPKTRVQRLYADILRHALAPAAELTEAGDQLLYESGTPTWYERPDPHDPVVAPLPAARPLNIQLSPLPDSTTRRAWPSTSPSAHEGDGSVTGADLLRSGGGDARTRGLVFHDWFECVGFVDEPGGVPEDDRLRSRARRHSPTLSDAEIDSWILQFREALQKPQIRAALQRSGAKELWRERAFALREDGHLLQGRLDRVAIWENRALLLDFKTDTAGAAAGDHYRAQVDSYRRALCALLGLPAEAVEARLIFVASGDVLSM